MAADPEDRLIGRLFDGRYRILRRLGSGGMAEVYLAEDEELGRKVALKMLNERHARDEQFVERFKREARNAAGLSHPHIVRIYDRGQAEGTYYIAMEYLDGPTLKELLTRKGPTPPLTAIKFAREILSALAEAHRNDIVHRDIKPHNVIVGPDWNVKVTDFGIARSGASQMTEAGSIVGTAQYLSPEQARGKPVDQRSDLYSLGIVLYELLTGKVPFTGDAAVEIAMKHLNAVPDPPSKLRPEISHDLDAVVMRALAKDPDQRYSSAEEMDADLARVARGAAVSSRTEEAMTQVLSGGGSSTAATTISPPLVAPPPAPPAYRPPSFYDEVPRRRSVWPMLLILFALAVAGVGGYLIYHKVETTVNANKPVAVQDVRRYTLANAKAALKSQGLLWNVTYAADSAIPKGDVINQSPGPGGQAAKGSTVNLVVSSGYPQTTVPAVIGFTQDQAESLLENASLKAKVRPIHSPTATAGTVTASAPHGGSTVPKNSTVTINVSQGPKQVAVPTVVGTQYANAASAVKGADLVPVRDNQPNAAPVGQVTASDPTSGTLVPLGSKVTLTVSTGPQTVAVPSVVGDDEVTAAQLITQAGLNPTVIYQDVTDPSQNGLVFDQSPRGGKLQQGSSVTVTVGRLVASTTTTTPASTATTTTTTAQTTTAGATTATTTTTTGATGATGATGTTGVTGTTGTTGTTTTTTTTAGAPPPGPPPP
jgi:eukaryotic-like serine/threonine-protein kinase